MSQRFISNHCISCGAYLMGGLTRHALDCQIRAFIAEAFPDHKLPEPEEADAGEEANER